MTQELNTIMMRVFSAMDVNKVNSTFPLNDFSCIKPMSQKRMFS